MTKQTSKIIFNYYKTKKLYYWRCLKYLFVNKDQCILKVNKMLKDEIFTICETYKDDEFRRSKLVDLSIIQTSKIEELLTLIKLSNSNKEEVKNSSNDIDNLLLKIIDISVILYENNKMKFNIYNLWLYFIENAYINENFNALYQTYIRLLRLANNMTSNNHSNELDVMFKNRLRIYKNSFEYTLNEKDL